MTELVAVYRSDREAFSTFRHLRRVLLHREVLLMFAVRDLKVRYKQTLLGVLWAVIPPFMLMVVFNIVFSRFARMPSEGLPYPVFAYSALLPWSFFSSSIGAAANSLVSNVGIISKIHFPREILPFSVIIAAGADFLIASLIFVGLAAHYSVVPTWNVLYVVPLLAVQVVLMAAIGMFVAAVNVYYRDVRYALPLVLQLWLYATPVAYPLEVVPIAPRLLYFIVNPMAGLVDGYRRVLAHGTPPDLAAVGLSAATAVVVFLVCYRVFKHLERQFADVM